MLNPSVVTVELCSLSYGQASGTQTCGQASGQAQTKTQKELKQRWGIKKTTKQKTTIPQTPKRKIKQHPKPRNSHSGHLQEQQALVVQVGLGSAVFSSITCHSRQMSSGTCLLLQTLHIQHTPAGTVTPLSL